MKDIDRYSVSGGEGARDGDRRGGRHDRPGWLTHLLRRQSLLRGSGSFWGLSGILRGPSGSAVFLESFGVVLGSFGGPGSRFFSGILWGSSGVLLGVFLGSC